MNRGYEDFHLMTMQVESDVVLGQLEKVPGVIDALGKGSKDFRERLDTVPAIQVFVQVPILLLTVF